MVQQPSPAVVRLNAPFAGEQGREALRGLNAGDQVLLSGSVLAARDAAHKRLCALLAKGEPLPFEIRNAVFYYMGPTPAPPGRPIGSAGPTTSSRMDIYTPALLEAGLAAMIGKGNRSPDVIESMKRHGAVYFAATGGAGALLSTCILAAETVAFDELGPEAVRRLTVRDFPVRVAIDARGQNLYETGVSLYFGQNTER